MSQTAFGGGTVRLVLRVDGWSVAELGLLKVSSTTVDLRIPWPWPIALVKGRHRRRWDLSAQSSLVLNSLSITTVFPHSLCLCALLLRQLLSLCHALCAACGVKAKVWLLMWESS